MKKFGKTKVQNENTNSEITEPEVIIVSDETVDEIIEIEPEVIPVVEETKEPEVYDIEDDNMPPAFKEKEGESESIPETKPDPENPEVSEKQKIKALKRAIEFKQSAIEREEIKVKDWRVQGKDRDEKATSEFQKRKTMLEELLKKNEERYQKRMAKTEKWWHQYCRNHETTKIKKLQDDLTLLQTELAKHEAKPEEAK
jgi:hypothetical protein